MSETRKDTPAMSRTIDAISGNTTQFATAMIGG
ncbi:chemotaxis protein CheW, partial [Rhodopseudomonas sp. BR0G17]|nr:chemotaxis protein CheW [Rhodopseudomonas sp. BR0G17]